MLSTSRLRPKKGWVDVCDLDLCLQQLTGILLINWLCLYWVRSIAFLKSTELLDLYLMLVE